MPSDAFKTSGAIKWSCKKQKGPSNENTDVKKEITKFDKKIYQNQLQIFNDAEKLPFPHVLILHNIYYRT